jgi:TatA/E family protein of Tat protein translocase
MLSIPHLIVLFVVALVVFGPEKLPELARNLGKAMSEFRRISNEMRYTFEDHMREIERETGARNAKPNPPSAQPAENTIAFRPAALTDASKPAAEPGLAPLENPESPSAEPANPPDSPASPETEKNVGAGPA